MPVGVLCGIHVKSCYMYISFPFQIMRVVSEKLEAENSWVLEKQQVQFLIIRYMLSSFRAEFLQKCINYVYKASLLYLVNFVGSK